MSALFAEWPNAEMSDEVVRKCRNAWLDGAIEEAEFHAYFAGVAWARQQYGAAAKPFAYAPAPAAQQAPSCGRKKDKQGLPVVGVLNLPDGPKPGSEEHAWRKYLAAAERAGTLLAEYLDAPARSDAMLYDYIAAAREAERRLQTYTTIRRYAFEEK